MPRKAKPFKGVTCVTLGAEGATKSVLHLIHVRFFKLKIQIGDP